jgi:hypothetical protein
MVAAGGAGYGGSAATKLEKDRKATKDVRQIMPDLTVKAVLVDGQEDV